MINIKEDNTDFDGIINSYKSKIAQLNAQLSDQQRTIDSLRSEFSSRRVNEVKTTNIVHHGDQNLKQEIAILNQRIQDLKIENDKYQSMLKSAKSTEKVIVKEIHDGQAFGMSAKEIEQLALRNAALELELKRLLDQNKSSIGQTVTQTYTQGQTYTPLTGQTIRREYVSSNNLGQTQ